MLWIEVWSGFRTLVQFGSGSGSRVLFLILVKNVTKIVLRNTFFKETKRNRKKFLVSWVYRLWVVNFILNLTPFASNLSLFFLCGSVYVIRMHKVTEYGSNLDPDPQHWFKLYWITSALVCGQAWLRWISWRPSVTPTVRGQLSSYLRSPLSCWWSDRSDGWKSPASG